MAQNTNPTLSDSQRQTLLDAQYAQALAGDSSLLIHLGKNYLNQIEKHHHTVEAVPFSDKSIEEIQDLLAQRAKEAEEEKLLLELKNEMAPIRKAKQPKVKKMVKAADALERALSVASNVSILGLPKSYD